MGMGEAGQILSQIRGLERFLRWGQRGMGDPSELNLEELREILGDEAYEHLKYLKSVEQTLEDEGYIVRTNHGLRLTPKGMRKIGDKALREIFQMLNKGRWGNHATSMPRLQRRPHGGDQTIRVRRSAQRQYRRDSAERLGETQKRRTAAASRRKISPCIGSSIRPSAKPRC